MHKSISANVDTVPRKNLNEFLRPYIEKHAFKGIACLFDSDGRQIIHSSSAEYTIKTKFRIASLSKPFLALLILREFEDLDTYLSSDLFPLSDGCQFPSVWSTITIRQLLSHESGIPDCLSNKELYDFISDPSERNLRKSTDTLFIEGGQGNYNYSNSNYFILTRLLEVKLGSPYSRILNEFVSNLHMSNTGLVTDEKDLDKTGGRWEDDTGEYVSIPLKFKHAGGAAGMYSTIEDMFKFTRVIVNLWNGIQDESLANSRLTKDIIDKALTKGDGEYGLGFHFFENGSFGHGGMFGGFRTKLMMNLEGQGVIEMQDQINASPKIADAIYDYFILKKVQLNLFPEFRLKTGPLPYDLESFFSTKKRYENSMKTNRVVAYELYSNGSKLMATKHVNDGGTLDNCNFEIKLADVADDSAIFVREFQPEKIVLGESQITVSLWDYNDGWTEMTFRPPHSI